MKLRPDLPEVVPDQRASYKSKKISRKENAGMEETSAENTAEKLATPIDF
jgi:hypothetical protein